LLITSIPNAKKLAISLSSAGLWVGQMIRIGLVYSNLRKFISDKWRQIDLTFDISHGCEARLTPVGRL
jgi:hypothetical protein